MKAYIVYDATTGAILRTGTVQDHLLDFLPNFGEAVMAAQARDDIQFVDVSVPGKPVILLKPALGATPDKTTVLADGVDVVTISGLPDPTSFTLTGSGVQDSGTVTDGVLALTFDTPGKYQIELRAMNKLPQQVEINAT